MTLFEKPKALGRRKQVNFYVLRCPQFSNRNCNMAVKVFELTKDGTLKSIGANYAINTASWKGEEGEGVSIIAKAYPDLKHNRYRILDQRVRAYQVIS